MGGSLRRSSAGGLANLARSSQSSDPVAHVWCLARVPDCLSNKHTRTRTHTSSHFPLPAKKSTHRHPQPTKPSSTTSSHRPHLTFMLGHSGRRACPCPSRCGSSQPLEGGKELLSRDGADTVSVLSPIGIRTMHDVASGLIHKITAIDHTGRALVLHNL